MLMDRGDTALFRINRTTGKGLWEGPGQARFLTLPIDVQDDKRIDRPVIEIDTERTIEDESAQHVSMKATWQDSMAIDQHFNDDAGLVDFRGTVVARSQQSPVELTEVQSDSLQFEFTKVQDNALGETPSSETNDTENPDTDTRQLQKIIARENATFEHRLWNQDAPEELPVVYFIGGNHIEYETDNAELLAVGDGTLVIRDNRAPLKTTHQSSLAGRGTTKFTWDGHLRTTKLTDTLYRITMQEHVEMAHRGLDGQVGMLTADSMKAISQNTSEEEPTDQSTLALRGMDVQELQASGDVYVSTTTRRVDCDVFDYNLMTGLAKLSATNGRTVAIVTAGTPYPVRAKSILWNMDPGIDSIEIKGLQGNAVQ